MKELQLVKLQFVIAQIGYLLGVIMLATLLTFSICTGFNDQNVLYIINETMDALGIIMLLIVMNSVLRELKIRNELDSVSWWFFLALFFICLGLFTDFFAWGVQGIPRLRRVNFIVNTVYYLCGPISIYIYWKYVKEIIEYTEGVSSCVFEWIQNSIIIFAIVATILNIFFHFYFSVGVDGIYKRTSGSFVLNALPNIIMVFICIRTIHRSRISLKNKVILIIYGLIPFLTSILQIFLFGMSILFTGTMCMALIVYTNIQAKRNIELMEQKMKVMQSQLQPHFIYNAMLSIRRLIKKSPQDAIAAMDHFGSYLRGSIDLYDAEHMILVSQELNFLRDYLEIEKVRFGEKIQYEIQEESDFLIPPLTIQPLVENAIRHGIRKKVDGKGKVEIRVMDREKEHVIYVKDDGVGFDLKEKLSTDRSHIGLSNTKKRVKYLLKGNLEINSEVGKGTTIEIRIPK